MSVYTFRVWFSGLVHFVPNKNPHAKCQLCAVLPRTGGGRAHKGVIYKPKWVVECGRRRLRAGDPIVPLEDRRIVFDITRGDALPPLPFEHSAPGVLSMDDVVGIFTDEDESIVSADPPEDRVLAQILFGAGYSMDIDYEVSIERRWTIPSTLTGIELTASLFDPVYIDVPNVKKVTLKSKPLRVGIDCEEELHPNEHGLIEIFVSHRCEKDCLTIGDVYPIRTPNSFVLMQRDTDFESNYKLLHPSTIENIKKTLGKAAGKKPDEVKLPIPESPLLEFYLAPHICCDPKSRERGSYERKGRLGRSLWSRVNRLLDRMTSRGWGKQLLEILLGLLGTGTGSGNDCLGGTSKARFFFLDDFIPGPDLTVDMGLLHSKHQFEKEMAALRFRQNPDQEISPVVTGSGLTADTNKRRRS